MGSLSSWKCPSPAAAVAAACISYNDSIRNFIENHKGNMQLMNKVIISEPLKESMREQ